MAGRPLRRARENASLPLQVFVTRGSFNFAKLPKGKLKIENRGGLGNKPQGAFWTSSLKGRESMWIEYCSTDYRDAIGPEAALFKPWPQAKILWLRNIKDFDRAWEKYPLPIDSRLSTEYDPGKDAWVKKRILDWKAIARDYDAVTCPDCQWGSYWGDLAMPMYGWDVESTAWFNMDALRLVDIVEIEDCELKL